MGNIGYGRLYDNVTGNDILDEHGCEIWVEWELNWSYVGGSYVGDISNNGFFANSSTYPLPSQKRFIENNITNDPQFVDAEHGNYRLLPTSPCIDAAGWVATNVVIDLDGNPRVSGIAPDIGAYEFQCIVSPIPELAPSATSADVAMALLGSADDNLVANVTNAAQYAAYRDWALAVKDADGVSVAGAQKVKDSSRAWLSFALGTDRIVPDILTSNDIKIESFEPMVEDGKFVFEVSIVDVGIGAGVTITEVNREAIIGNIKKVLNVEGATTLTLGAFSSDNITTSFDAPANGKARITVTLPDSVSGSFFLRVKVRP